MNLKNKNFEVFGSFSATESKADSSVIKIAGYANTVSKDRSGDVILESAWHTKNALTNYLKNPIILAFHNHSMPIGKMVDYGIDSKGLFIEAEVYDDGSAAYKQIKNGVLKTFSVGFRCLDADYNDKTDIFSIKDLELLEVSVVSVPCNQDSVFSVSKDATDIDRVAFPSSITVPDAVVSQQLTVRDAVLKESSFLTALATLDVNAQYGLQGYFESSQMKEVKVGRKMRKQEKILTTETNEDANFSLVPHMERAMRDAAKLDIEAKMAALLLAKAGASTATSASKNWATVVDMYKALDKKVRNAEGQLYFFTSEATATDIKESQAYFQSELKSKIKVIGVEDLADTDAIMAHSFGIFGRVEMNRGIEVSTLAPSDAKKYILGYGYGLEVDSAYVVKKTLA